MSVSKKTKPASPEKEKKPKLVRDSFTIPKNEYAAIDVLKARALTLGLAVKKSELLRAGLMALDGLSDARLKTVLASVPTLKTGRPSAQESAASAEAVAENTAAAPADQPAAGPAKPAAAPRKTRRSRTATSAPAQ